MPYSSGPSASRPASGLRSLLPAVLAAPLLLAAAPYGPGASGTLRAQTPDDVPLDSAELVDEARDRQRDFEFLRQRRTPAARLSREGGCDEQIGRICIWFGGAEEGNFPPELQEVRQQRRNLIAFFLETEERIDDPWVTGQLVHYLVEEEELAAAEQVARACKLEDRWWCQALLGYALHVHDEFVEAEEAFRTALATMPGEVRERWTSPRYIFTRDAEDHFEDVEGAERERRWEHFWRLSDPLFLVEGNDRLTEHWARIVEAMNREDAEHPQGIFWEEDLEETLIRYGRTIGFSSASRMPRMPGPGGRMGLQDSRRIIAHHRPESRGYRFPEAFLPSPADIPPESWITAPREAFSWYVPPYAPDFRGLETQVGRFRRGSEMLLVGAYRPAPLSRGDGEAPFGPADPFEVVEGPLKTALFLVPEDGGEAVRVEGTEPEGVLTLRADPGRYVSSLELFDERGGRAWRARQGVKQEPLVPGVVGVSDLLILEPDAELPDSLDAAIPVVRPGVRIRPGERFVVVWEVYGLRIQEAVQVSVGFSEGHPDFLRPVEDFEEILPPEGPVEIRFTDPGPERVQTVFRALQMQLPELEPGPYTLHLRLDLAGREPVFASRPIEVEG